MARPAWWQSAIIYHIYPRSFQDTNGDGVGDLTGILNRLDYLAWLGVDAVWLSPIYPSPMADFGYDIADFTAIDPLFGSFADFDALIDAAHRRGIRLILDYVPNHSSDRHPWFQEARGARGAAKRDWYLWREPAPGDGPPNNWLSEFGGPAWSLDAATGQYYLHSYLREQPDLNWRSPGLRAAMESVMRFWLDRGVDGFRLDALHHVIKDAAFRDNPPNPDFGPGMAPHQALKRLYTVDRPEVHDIIAGLRRLADIYGERVLIGEINLPRARLMRYYGDERQSELHLPFNFALLRTPWTAAELGAEIAAYEAALPPGAWPNWVLGNHDTSRVASRLQRLGAAGPRLAAVLLLTLRGTPTMYYGDEIGMADVPIAPDEVRDPFERNVPGRGRDPERTPMRWSGAPQGGFTTGMPWLPMGDEVATRNVETEASDPASLLSLYRRLIQLRRQEPALALGAYSPVAVDSECLGYLRQSGSSRLLVLLNFAQAERAIPLPSAFGGDLLLSSDAARRPGPIQGRVALGSREAAVLRLG
jgi:alpha-glucosidase